MPNLFISDSIYVTFQEKTLSIEKVKIAPSSLLKPSRINHVLHWIPSEWRLGKPNAAKLASGQKSVLS